MAGGLARALQQPRIVIGEVVDYDWQLNTARVYTNHFGIIECRVGVGYSDVDWPTSGAPQDNTQFGQKRTLKERERVVVLLLDDCRVTDGVVVCSLATVEHKLNTTPQVQGENGKNYEIEGKHVIHLRDDYWFRTIKTVMLIAVEDALLRSESANVAVEARNNVNVLAEQENVSIDSAEKTVTVHAGENVEVDAEQDVVLTIGRNLRASVDGSANVQVDNALVTDSGGRTTIKAPAIQLGSAAVYSLTLAETLLAAVDTMLAAFSVWAQSHVHPCTPPGAPSGPSLVPAAPVTSAWNGAKNASKSTLVSVES